MPTYAYVCTECAHSFDIVQAITDDALTECPSCGGQLRKKFHPVGVTFKGSGFYRTDSRSGSSTADASTSTSKGESTSSTGSSSSDTSSSSSSSTNGSSSSSGSSSSGSGGSSAASTPASTSG